MKLISIFVKIGFILLITACGTVDEPQREGSEPTIEEEEPVQVEEDGEAELEDPNVEEDSYTFSEVIEDYRVLSSFETDGPGTGLGLGMEILYEADDAVFVRGHQGHALGHYRILQVDQEQHQVVITHQYSEEQYETYEEIQRIIEQEGVESAFEWVQEQDSNINELFFTSEIPPNTTIVTWKDQEWKAIEVEVKEGDEKYVFAKEKGLIQINYQSELSQEIFGEVRVANRIEDE